MPNQYHVVILLSTDLLYLPLKMKVKDNTEVQRYNLKLQKVETNKYVLDYTTRITQQNTK